MKQNNQKYILIVKLIFLHRRELLGLLFFFPTKQKARKIKG